MSSVTYLNHDHSKSENIRFFAIRPLVQDLWRSPPRGISMSTRGAPHGIQVASDRSEAKIRQTCMTGVVHKDVLLDMYQYGGEARHGTTTYPLEVPMNDIAGVEVAEALSDVG